MSCVNFPRRHEDSYKADTKTVCASIMSPAGFLAILGYVATFHSFAQADYTCDSGDCVIDCTDIDCKGEDIICTNTATSCMYYFTL